MRSDDRVIKLSKIEGKSPLSTNGLVDNRLFTGDNKLHAVREPNGLWSLYYERGTLETALRVKFTSYPALIKYLEDYYRKRNIKIEEVLD